MKKAKMSARVWTNKQCKQTLKEGIANGFQVIKYGMMTKIMDGETLVVSWLKGSAAMGNLVRINTEYFEA